MRCAAIPLVFVANSMAPAADAKVPTSAMVMSVAELPAPTGAERFAAEAAEGALSPPTLCTLVGESSSHSGAGPFSIRVAASSTSRSASLPFPGG